MGAFQSWLRQPTTITGLASLAGLGIGAAAHAYTGDGQLSVSVGALVFAAVHLVVNDNTLASDAQKIAEDVVSKSPTLQADVAAAVTDIAKDLTPK